MKIDRKKNTVRNVFWGYISKLLGLILPFIFRTVLIKVLGDEYLGINTLFTSILQVLSLSELGFGTAIVYSMYKPIANNDNDKINSLLNLYRKVYKIIGTIILVVGITIMPFIPKLISGSYPKEINIYFVYLLFLLNTVVSYYLFAYKSSLIMAFQRNDLDSKSLTITNILKTIFQLISIIVFRNFYYYLYVMLFSTIFNNIINYFIVKKYFPIYKPRGNISKSELSDIKNNVFSLICHKIGGIVLNSSDNIIISAFLGLSILTKYSNYYYVISSVEALIMIFFTSMVAGLGNSFATETKRKNNENFINIFFFNGYVTVISGTIIFSMYQDFILLWVGESYKFNIYMVCLFIVYFYLHTIRRTLIVFRDASGSWSDNKWQPIVSAIFNVVVNIILVCNIGIYGIIISTILSMIIVDIPWETKSFLSKKLDYDYKRYFLKITKYFFILFISCLFSFMIVKFCDSFITLNIYISLIIDFIIAFIISNILFYLFCHKEKSFMYYKTLLLKLVGKFLKEKKSIVK